MRAVHACGPAGFVESLRMLLAGRCAGFHAESFTPPAPVAHRPSAPLPVHRLNASLTFDSLVAGRANQMARTAALHVAGSPGHMYNPLFIYGGVGLGKTHLMHAIAHRVLSERPDARILYVSAERFTNDFIKSIQHHKMDEFRARWPERIETGTLNHEGIVGAAAAVDFLAGLAPGADRRAALNELLPTALAEQCTDDDISVRVPLKSKSGLCGPASPAGGCARTRSAAPGWPWWCGWAGRCRRRATTAWACSSSQMTH